MIGTRFPNLNLEGNQPPFHHKQHVRPNFQAQNHFADRALSAAFLIWWVPSRSAIFSIVDDSQREDTLL